MKDRVDKRRHRRLVLHFGVSYTKVGNNSEESYVGSVVNISSGGFYFETVEPARQGDLLKVAIEIPPTAGLLEFGGKLAGYGRVLRAERLSRDRAGIDPYCDRYGIAIEFCRPPRVLL